MRWPTPGLVLSCRRPAAQNTGSTAHRRRRPTRTDSALPGDQAREACSGRGCGGYPATAARRDLERSPTVSCTCGSPAGPPSLAKRGSPHVGCRGVVVAGEAASPGDRILERCAAPARLATDEQP